jgi:pimeloyl-ACP methyl ester carboxylesterase
MTTPVHDRRRPGGAAAGARRRPTSPPFAVDRLLGVGLAVGVAVAWGLLAGWWTPRGPLTTGQALASLGIGLAVGAAAGVLTRSRWSMLLAPTVFVAVFELTRLGTDGPTVDGIHASTYGLIALAVGRGVHGLLAVVPMLLGAALGAAYARRIADATGPYRPRVRVGGYARRAVAGLTAVVLVVLAAAIARPASTAQITGPDGEPVPGSIAELTRVDINGHDLALMVRGRSVDNPVLLFLAGGPGGTELGAMRNHGQDLERDFTVVTWDQRGTGRSYDQLDPVSTLTPENAVDDTIAVTTYLRDRFGQDRIYLVGQSWGTLLGVLATQRRPELYRAFVGTGQMVSPTATDRIFYEDTLAWARRTGNVSLVDTLERSGPPPYDSILDYEPALSYEQEVYPYDHSGNAEGEGQMAEGIFVGEYDLLDRLHNLGAFLDTFSVLYPQIQDVDLRADAASLDVPVYLFQGAHEARGRAEPAEEWFAMLDAPRKEMAVASTSGHRPLWEQPAAFHRFMTETVLEAEE